MLLITIDMIPLYVTIIYYEFTHSMSMKNLVNTYPTCLQTNPCLHGPHTGCTVPPMYTVLN